MKTILLIEDHPGIREMVGTILKLANYNVVFAINGKEGIELALTCKPDLILCDVRMPELDGYAVLHLLQMHDEVSGTPFIFMTSLSEREEVRKGMELGADDYIIKPFSGTELLSAVSSRLQKAAKMQSAASGTSRQKDQSQKITLNKAFEQQQELHQFGKKQVIYKERQQVFRLYLVKSGSVKVFKTTEDGKTLITRICMPGDFFGYQALLANAPLEESAETLENSEIASITKETFDELIYSHDVLKEIVSLLASNIHVAEEHLLVLAYNSLRKKVANALILLKPKYFLQESVSTVISLSRENMAAISGVARESLVRTLGDFRDEGLIEIKGNDIIILDERKLANLSN